MIALMGHGFKSVGYRRCTGCKRQRRNSSFKTGNPLLEHALCRIRQSGVNIPRLLKSKTCSSLITIFKNKSCTLVNGYCPCTACRIRLLLPYMNRSCVKRKISSRSILLAHSSTSIVKNHNKMSQASPVLLVKNKNTLPPLKNVLFRFFIKANVSFG